MPSISTSVVPSNELAVHRIALPGTRALTVLIAGCNTASPTPAAAPTQAPKPAAARFHACPSNRRAP